MASLFRTQGIVLARRDHREVDRVYSVLTREHGKLSIQARGARKMQAKLGPHLESFGVLDLLIVRGRMYDTVAGVERLQAFHPITDDLNKILLARQLLHLVDLGTRTEQIDPILYAEVIKWLEFIEAMPEVSSERSGFLLAAFALKLLSISGYRPELGFCLSCRRSVTPDTFRWHALKGGIVCDNCCIVDEEQWFAAREISDEALKLVRFALKERPEELLKPSIPGQLLLEYHDLVESLLICHFPTIPATSLRVASVV
ncbi:MAG: DNA repair protein RecO [Candidatus Uhrbacteria bacterium]|nr:DNA repair protein RecO [Patescibacteria group bacterium]MBU1907487.1 DNA repair protein RecO [Patescibacteria group bacterium]